MIKIFVICNKSVETERYDNLIFNLKMVILILILLIFSATLGKQILMININIIK